jgi:hypothetical protein
MPSAPVGASDGDGLALEVGHRADSAGGDDLPAAHVDPAQRDGRGAGLDPQQVDGAVAQIEVDLARAQGDQAVVGGVLGDLGVADVGEALLPQERLGQRQGGGAGDREDVGQPDARRLRRRLVRRLRPRFRPRRPALSAVVAVRGAGGQERPGGGRQAQPGGAPQQSTAAETAIGIPPLCHHAPLEAGAPAPAGSVDLS